MEERKMSEKRMYILVPYNLSPIQQGIQALHAVAELSIKRPNNKYHEWVREYKTVIILNAGTTGENSSMENHRINLDKLNVNYSTFREPDLKDWYQSCKIAA